jgi:hypothetical protein
VLNVCGALISDQDPLHSYGRNAERKSIKGRENSFAPVKEEGQPVRPVALVSTIGVGDFKRGTPDN